MADTIIIDNGIVTKTLKTTTGETCEVCFNPADPTFADKLYTAFTNLKKKQDEREITTAGMNDSEKFDWFRKQDAEMRETIDGVFEKPVCEALFGSVNMYASAGGTPVWMNLMLAIMDEMDESIKREKAFHSEKLAKYTKKYHR